MAPDASSAALRERSDDRRQGATARRLRVEWKKKMAVGMRQEFFSAGAIFLPRTRAGPLDRTHIVSQGHVEHMAFAVLEYKRHRLIFARSISKRMPICECSAREMDDNRPLSLFNKFH
jgi:hypothetical protein